jgi:hypothetical protein
MLRAALGGNCKPDAKREKLPEGPITAELNGEVTLTVCPLWANSGHRLLLDHFVGAGAR